MNLFGNLLFFRKFVVYQLISTIINSYRMTYLSNVSVQLSLIEYTVFIMIMCSYEFICEICGDSAAPRNRTPEEL